MDYLHERGMKYLSGHLGNLGGWVLTFVKGPMAVEPSRCPLSCFFVFVV